MRFTQILPLAAVGLSSSSVLARNVPRQVSSSSSSVSVVASTSAAASSTAVVSSVAPAATVAASSVAVATTSFSAIPFTGTFTLASTNPTAVPLASITESAATQATDALTASLIATPGATPPISGAPPLPSWSFVAGSFPALDLVPDTTTPQVQAWIQEVANSGVTIPDYAPTGIGGCSNSTNAAAVADTSRCWWTCGQCSRPTDITTCPDKLTWGLSYDDGPSPYTPDLLNYLDANSLKSTFFIVGSRAISRPAILQAEYMAGHQLSTHTWSHPYLTTLTNDQIIAELGWTREAIRQITGVSPNTMRPPYGDIDDRVRAICQAMGMTPIIWTTSGSIEYDTNDWHIPSGQSVLSVLQDWDAIVASASTLNTGFIVLAHDLYQQTVDLAIGYILPDALARRNPQFNLMPIITCLKKPLGDAYVETNNNATNPFASNALPLTGTAAITPTTVGGTATGTGSSTATGKKSAAVALVTGAWGAGAAAALSMVAGFMVLAL